MRSMVLEIPDDVVGALRVPATEKIGRLRWELAVRLYEQGLLTFGKARELAQVSKWEFHFLLGREKIIRHYDLEELEEDLKSLEVLG